MKRYLNIFVDGLISGLGWSLGIWIVVAIYLGTR